MIFRNVDLVRLQSGIVGITPIAIRAILEWSIKAGITLPELFKLEIAELMSLFALKEKVAQLLIASSEDTAFQTLEQLEKKNFQVVTFLDAHYPQSLHDSLGHKAPPLLYVYGDLTILSKPGIGFGGSRNVSSTGLYATDELARSVVKDYGYTVISGHAKGVDTIAHQSALAAHGATILVVPEGALRFRLNEDLRAYWADAKEQIVVVTHFAPHEPWSGRNAMIRNETVIGLSKAFCVIESGDESGGTWAAGQSALGLRMPLYVMQYENAPVSAAGNHKLIHAGGIPIPYQPKDLRFPDVNTTVPLSVSQLPDSAGLYQPLLFGD